MNRKLHDYLDARKVRVLCTSGQTYVGFPLTVNYADETESGEDELTIEIHEQGLHRIIGFRESDIKSIEFTE